MTESRKLTAMLWLAVFAWAALGFLRAGVLSGGWVAIACVICIVVLAGIRVDALAQYFKPDRPPCQKDAAIKALLLDCKERGIVGMYDAGQDTFFVVGQNGEKTPVAIRLPGLG